MSRVASVRSGLEGIAVYSALGVDIGPFSRSTWTDFEVASIRSGLEGIAIPSTLGVDIGPFLEK